MILSIQNMEDKERICRCILAELPGWFGLEESTQEYIRESRMMPFWAEVEDGRALGFAAMKETSPYAAEIYVMGVLPEAHRRGIGRKLFECLHQAAKDEGKLFLQVKTVKQGCYPEYDQTNAFYKALGFKELEVFETLWDPWNPCQVYVRTI